MKIEEVIAHEKFKARIDRIKADKRLFPNNSEWLTDKEKRILFSALTREKSVCIQVDKQCEPREPYEQSLQSVCESLEHKFYYDRLFKRMEKQIMETAIDDFANVLKENYDYLPQILSQEAFGLYIDEYAERLKEGERE